MRKLAMICAAGLVVGACGKKGSDGTKTEGAPKTGGPAAARPEQVEATAGDDAAEFCTALLEAADVGALCPSKGNEIERKVATSSWKDHDTCTLHFSPELDLSADDPDARSVTIDVDRRKQGDYPERTASEADVKLGPGEVSEKDQEVIFFRGRYKVRIWSPHQVGATPTALCAGDAMEKLGRQIFARLPR